MNDVPSNRRPSYGVIYRTGEFVQCGDLLGLSVDGKTAVVAPTSGWVRCLPPCEFPSQAVQPLVCIEIWKNHEFYGDAACQIEIAG